VDAPVLGETSFGSASDTSLELGDGPVLEGDARQRVLLRELFEDVGVGRARGLGALG